MFKRTSANSRGLSHMVGLGLLVLLVPVVPYATPLLFGAATTLVLVLVAVWETISFARGPQPAAPSARPQEASLAK